MPTPVSDLVATSWLADHRRDVVLLDATWFLPTEQRDAATEFAAVHIPGAQWFDIDGIADRATSLPHMLPSPAAFATAVGAMGIDNATHIVVYDRNALAPAARVWWTFRAFGHDAVSVLDGGLPKWQAEGYPVSADRGQAAPRSFVAKLRPQLVAVLDEVRASKRQLVDARTSGRFHGSEPEPRPGLRGGHAPGSKNVPFRSLLAEDGTLLSPPALRRRFADAGVDASKSAITLCGSGITASLLALALHRIGAPHAAVYDGSWAEWGARADTPVEQ